MRSGGNSFRSDRPEDLGELPPIYKRRFTEDPMHIAPIIEMTNLSKRLGNSGIDRIRYAGKANTQKQPRASNVPNTVLVPMQFVRPNTPGCEVAEWIDAASRLDSNDSRPLNINRLYNILQCIEMINVREIQTMTDLGKKQAQKYLRAVKFVLPFLEDHFSV